MSAPTRWSFWLALPLLAACTEPPPPRPATRAPARSPAPPRALAPPLPDCAHRLTREPLDGSGQQSPARYLARPELRVLHQALRTSALLHEAADRLDGLKDRDVQEMGVRDRGACKSALAAHRAWLEARLGTLSATWMTARAAARRRTMTDVERRLEEARSSFEEELLDLHRRLWAFRRALTAHPANDPPEPRRVAPAIDHTRSLATLKAALVAATAGEMRREVLLDLGLVSWSAAAGQWALTQRRCFDPYRLRRTVPYPELREPLADVMSISSRWPSSVPRVVTAWAVEGFLPKNHRCEGDEPGAEAGSTPPAAAVHVQLAAARQVLLQAVCPAQEARFGGVVPALPDGLTLDPFSAFRRGEKIRMIEEDPTSIPVVDWSSVWPVLEAWDPFSACPAEPWMAPRTVVPHRERIDPDTAWLLVGMSLLMADPAPSLGEDELRTLSTRLRKQLGRASASKLQKALERETYALVRDRENRLRLVMDQAAVSALRRVRSRKGRESLHQTALWHRARIHLTSYTSKEALAVDPLDELLATSEGQRSPYRNLALRMLASHAFRRQMLEGGTVGWDWLVGYLTRRGRLDKPRLTYPVAVLVTLGRLAIEEASPPPDMDYSDISLMDHREVTFALKVNEAILGLAGWSGEARQPARPRYPQLALHRDLAVVQARVVRLYQVLSRSLDRDTRQAYSPARAQEVADLARARFSPGQPCLSPVSAPGTPRPGPRSFACTYQERWKDAPDVQQALRAILSGGGAF